MMRLPCLLSLACAIVLAAGCGPAKPTGPAPAKVSGKVTLDGRPMPGGEVRFGVEGQAPKTLEVKDGAFAGEVFSGKNKVEVVYEVDGKPHPMDPSKKLKENKVSSKFSGPNTTLNADVPAGGASDLKFDVKSGK